MRIFWTILAIAGGLVLLVLIAVAIAVWTVDVNQFVGPIQARVKDATGRDLDDRRRRRSQARARAEGRRQRRALRQRAVGEGAADAHREARRGGGRAAAAPPAALRARPAQSRRAGDRARDRRARQGQLGIRRCRGRGSGAAAAAGSPAAALAAFGIGNVEVTNGLLTYRDGTSDAMTRVAIDRFAAQARTPASPINAEFTGKVDDVPVALTGNLGPLDAVPVATRAVSGHRRGQGRRAKDQSRHQGSRRRKRRPVRRCRLGRGVEQGEGSDSGRDRRAAAENHAHAHLDDAVAFRPRASGRRRGGRPARRRKGGTDRARVHRRSGVVRGAAIAPTSTATSRSVNCSCATAGGLDRSARVSR